MEFELGKNNTGIFVSLKPENQQVTDEFELEEKLFNFGGLPFHDSIRGFRDIHDSLREG